jgi:ABC-type oligopeptide transport system ATPase subunit
MPLVSLKNVTRVYRLGELSLTALNAIDLEVDRGEFVAIWGPSGSGKSTLCNILGAIDHPTSGSIKIDDQDIAGLSDNCQSMLRNRSVGFVFQSFNLIKVLAAVCTASDPAVTPYEILKECDEARGNLGGITWTVFVEALERGRKNAHRILVKSSGFNVVAETLMPPRRKGQLLILVKGNMWFYKPDLSKPVPVSQRQKRLGLAANGDIASTNYAEDYDILSFDFQNLTYGLVQQPVNSVLNPYNREKVPRYILASNFRPDFAFRSSRLNLQLKPRFDFVWERYEDGICDGQEDTDQSYYVNEWLVRIEPVDSLFISYGREDLQPAPGLPVMAQTNSATCSITAPWWVWSSFFDFG